MKVLLVSYDFPPVGGMGVQRVSKLARYLPEHGITPVVLTNAHGLGNVQDPELLARNGLQGLEVIRLGGERLAALYSARASGRRAPPGRLPEFLWSVLRHGDIYGLWYRSLRSRLPELARSSGAEIVWTTLPPASTGFIGWHIARTVGMPWVLDFRDSLVANIDHQQDFPGRLQARVAPGIERRFVGRADRIIAVSQPIIDNLAGRMGDSVREKSRLIPNGFDPQDCAPAGAPVRNERLSFIYAGTFLGRRRPDVLVAGVQWAVSHGLVDPQALRFDFYGQYAPEVMATLAGMPAAVERRFHGFVPQSQVFAAVQQADCALVITVPGTEPAMHEVMTGKIFEYLGLGKRVLALTDSAPLRTLIATARLGDSVDAGNPQAVAHMLGALYAQWRRDGHLACSPDPAVTAQYDRRAQAGQLAQVFRELAGRKP